MNLVKDVMYDFVEEFSTWVTHQQTVYNIDHIKEFEYFCDLPCYEYTDVSVINSCQDNVIVIFNFTEGLHSKHYYSKYNNNKHYIIMCNDIWNTDKVNIGIDNYTVIYWPYFLFDIITTTFSTYKFNFYFNKLYDFVYPKPNYFVSTTGNVRPERTYFLEQIIKDIPYKNYIFKYSGEDFGNPSDHLDLLTFKKGEFDPYTPYINNEHYVNVSQTVPVNLYNSAYFNLLVETDVTLEHNFFVTEKTIKCLITGIPFVVLSTPYFLKQFHELGFKTYSTVWNEDYDNIEDFETRVSAIKDLVHSLGLIDWNKHREELQNIAAYNVRNFLNLDKLATSCFNKLIEEIKLYERRH